LAEHLLHAGGVVFILDGEAGGVLGEVEVDDDGFLDLAEHGLGAGGEGVDGVGGQIEACGKRRREVVDEDEADEEEDDGEGFGAEFHGGGAGRKVESEEVEAERAGSADGDGRLSVRGRRR
jgi:hypothetical protein